MPRSAPAPVRNRRARNSLTADVILDAAEEVAARGFESLTIRAVAAELKSSPMGLYRYFSTKEELVAALLDRVLGRFEPVAETDRWLDDLRTFALHHREMLVDHPWAILPLTGNPVPGPNALPIGEVALRILGRGGITGDAAVATFSGLIAFNYGCMSFVVGRDRAAGFRPDEGITPLPATPPEFPLTAELAEPMSRYGSDEHYAIAMGQLLTGIGADAGRH